MFKKTLFFVISDHISPRILHIALKPNYAMLYLKEQRMRVEEKGGKTK